MSKVKVIIHCSRTSGVDHHRLVSPFRLLEGQVEVVWIDTLDKRKEFDAELIGRADHGYLKDATHVIGSRFWRYQGLNGIAYFINEMRKRNVKVIIDNDDDIVVPKWNPAYFKYHMEGISNAIRFSIQEADEVWVTQKKLAKEMKRYNKRVRIIPNGIDTTQRQWQQHNLPTEEMRFGYLSGSSHFRDVQWAGIDLSGLEGYAMAGDMTFSDEDFNKAVAQIQQDEAAREAAGHANMSKQRIAMALEHKKMRENITNGKTMAEWMNANHELDFQPVNTYAELYRNIDVALIPLRPGKFNSMKSNLKLLEAGFAKKAAIVSNVYPYTIRLKPNEMCIAIGGNEMRSMDWNKPIRELTHSRAVELAEALHEWVQPYELSKINDLRLQCLNS